MGNRKQAGLAGSLPSGQPPAHHSRWKGWTELSIDVREACTQQDFQKPPDPLGSLEGSGYLTLLSDPPTLGIPETQEPAVFTCPLPCLAPTLVFPLRPGCQNKRSSLELPPSRHIVSFCHSEKQLALLLPLLNLGDLKSVESLLVNHHAFWSNSYKQHSSDSSAKTEN